MTENLNEEQFTKEQIEEMRNRMNDYYVEQIPYLETQAKYETLLMTIEESRLKRLHFTNQIAAMIEAQKNPEKAQKEPAKERTLRTEK